MNYAVNDIYTCIQGEGVHTGVPMVLLRLHGCDVGCPWCDTKETWAVDPAQQVSSIDAALGANAHYSEQPAEVIAAYVHTHYPHFKWVLITGGEPARFDLYPLVSELQRLGYRCALETSGTELGHIHAGVDWVCVSPKINMPGGRPIRPAAIAVADEIKMVIGRERDVTTLDTLLAHCTTKEHVQICLQPMSQNEKATQICIETVQMRGWRLSIQLHKFISQR